MAAGKKTSVYLPADVQAQVSASGMPLADIIRRGLESLALEGAVTPLSVALQAEALARRARLLAVGPDHPG